jgi:hypothetical protein
MTPTAPRGYVYAATGAVYTNLARRAARNLRLVMPGAQVDLFTDQPVTDPVFNQILPLERVSHRPKMEAMRRSRFECTVLLDAAAFPIMRVNDLFDLADIYELSATMNFIRPHAVFASQTHIPRAFPYLNAGVMAFRKTPLMMRLIDAWEHEVLDNNQPQDQPSLRALIYAMKINFMVLPREYNVIYLRALEHWPPVFGCPRILHVPDLYKRPMGNPEEPIGLVEALGTDYARTVQGLLDRRKAKPSGEAPALAPLTPWKPASDSSQTRLR